MVKLAIVVLAAACLAAVVLGQRPTDQPWGGLVVEDDSRQDSSSSSWTAILANLITNIVAPFLQNVATGITNAITATFANRTLRYIPLPYVPAEPIYRLPSPPRPYGGDDYPSFYREPSSRPAPGAEPYRRRPAPVDSPEHTN